jgi:hypothetical protein
MEFSEWKWEGRGAVTEDHSEESDPGDLYPEHVTATLLGVAGFLGLVMLLAVIGALGAATALLRLW